MKTKYIKLFAILAIIIGMLPLKVLGAGEIPEATKNFYVNDYAKVIDKETEEEMAKQGKRLDEKYGAQVVLVTVNSTGKISIGEYASQLFNQWGIGDKDKNNGLLILFSIKDDDYWVLQGKGLEKTLTNDKISDTLWEYLEPDFAKKDYNAGAKKIYNVFFKKVAAISKAEVKDSKENLSSTKNTDGQKDSLQEGSITYVYDKANILNQKDKDYINKKSSESKEKYDASFYVVTKEVSDADSFQEDTIQVFEEIKADVRDIVLVMYEKDDNYWILPGNVAQDYATQSVLNRIINEVLEPEFAEKAYGKGAIATSDEFYKLFENSYETIETPIKQTENTAGNGNLTNQKNISDSEAGGDKVSPIAFLLLVLLILGMISSSRRKKYVRIYGIPFNPYSRRHVRLYGPNGYWGRYGPPPAGGGYWYGGRWHTSPRPRQYNNYSYRNDSEPSRSSGSSWGSNGGAGRPTSHSSSGSRSFGSSSYGGGSSSSSGGAGRSFSSSSSSSSRSSSSSSSSSSGGGGRASSGGGAGRSSGGGAGRGR